MAQPPLVIINPASAGGRTRRQWPGIASALGTHFGPFNCAFTERAGDGIRLALRAAEAGRRLIIACGGDGTISEVANGILSAGGEAELGILPSGTGGDFRRTLAVSARASDAARALRCGRTRHIDVGRAVFLNHEGAEETRYFVNVASFGMGARVVERVRSGSTWLGAGTSSLLGGSGTATFAAAALQTVLTYPHPTVRLRIDDKPEFALTVVNLCVANAQYFGGGMHIAPQAKLNDNLLDLIAIGDLSAMSILTNSYRLYLGTHLGLRDVRSARAARVAARSANGEDEIGIEIDGELVGRLPATFEILPRALRVRCPA